MRRWSWDGSSLGAPLKGHVGHVVSVAISPDGETIVSGAGDGTVRHWTQNSGSLGRPFEGDHGMVISVAISPNGEIIGLSAW